MKKVLFVFSLVLIFNVNAQVSIGQRCGTPDLPLQFEGWLQSIKPAPGKYGTANVQSVFNIPVIVHILHNNEPVNGVSATSGNNLNAAQVVDQINILNKDFNGTNADTNLIPSVFKPVLGKFQVNFCLAAVNPTGGVLTEPGIDRINIVSKGWSSLPYSSGYITSTVKPNSIWNPNLYLNIWVAPLSNGLLGYATFPNPGTSGIQGLSGTFGSSTTDGVVILNSSFGSIGTAQTGAYNKGRTATHEIGHWMGLRHIWGDSNCGTDYCNDTPPAQTSNFGCPAYPYHVGTCSGNTTGEMTMNYMDYTNDACMYMFTADQKYRAQLILTYSTMRAALITSTVCNLPSVGNDVGISFVSSPTYSQILSCINSFTPVLNITNYGSTTLTSALFSFNVDGVNTQTMSWAGSLAPSASFTVALTQVTGLSSGAHVFSVNVSSPNGGSDNNLTNNNNQQLFSIVTNSFAFNAPSGTVCQGNTLVLTASGASSYSWNTGVNTASISLSPSVTTVYTVTGFYGLCVMPKTVTVTVQTSPFISLNKTHVCEGMPASLTASGANSYTWSSGETSASINVTLFTSTNYTVTGMTTAGCVNTQTYTILTDPLPTTTISPSNLSCNSCSDATLSVNASGGTAPYSYNWMPGNIITQSAPNLGNGCYVVTVTDALGCSAVDSACVSFDTGIFTQSISGSPVKIWPNPGAGKFVFEFNLTGNKRIEIMDPLGKIIQRAETNSATVLMDISLNAGGVYYARITSGSGYSVVKLMKN